MLDRLGGRANSGQLLLSRREVGLTSRLALSTLVAWGVLYYAFSMVLPRMQAELGWSTATLTGGFSLALLVSGLLGPWVGRQLDLRGSRVPMTVGSFVGVAALGLWSVAETVFGYYLAWGLMGVAMAANLYEPAFATVVRDHPQRSARSVLIISLVGAFAATIFLPVVEELAKLRGWRGALEILAVVLGVTGVAVGLSLPTSQTSAKQPGPEAAEARSRPGFDSTLRRLAIASALSSAVGVAYNAHVVVFLLASGNTAATAAVIAGAAGYAKFAGRLATIVAGRWSAIRLLRGSLWIQGMSVAPALLWPSTGSMVVMVVAFGFCSGARTVLRPAAVLQLCGTARFGERSGRVQMVAMLGRSAAPASFALLWGAVSPAIAWGVLAGSLGLSAMVVPRAKTAGP